MDDEPSTPDESADLRHAAAANREATWGDGERPAARVPGLLSGDVGPKGRVSAQLRDLSRAERRARGQVPRGATGGSGAWLLVPMFAVALVLLGVVVLMGWLAR